MFVHLHVPDPAPSTLDGLVRNGTLAESTATQLTAAVRDGASVLVAGGTGSGKTVLAHCLAAAAGTATGVVAVTEHQERGVHRRRVAYPVGDVAGTQVQEAVDRAVDRWHAIRDGRVLLVVDELGSAAAAVVLDQQVPTIATIHARSASAALARAARVAPGLVAHQAFPVVALAQRREGGRVVRAYRVHGANPDGTFDLRPL